MTAIRIGTAGWAIPAAAADAFAPVGTHLERYADRFAAVEINSSFHRPHRHATYARWAASTPAGFAFAVKLPKSVSHVHRLIGADALLDAFADQVSGLGTRLKVVLVQLPPSLAFESEVAAAFLEGLRRRLGDPVDIACEPRHASWFAADADACLADRRVARVAADPVLAPGGEHPGGWRGLRYHRLHGSPRVYYSAYDALQLAALARAVTGPPANGTRWCIFDNTAAGAATGDALRLQSLLARGDPSRG